MKQYTEPELRKIISKKYHSMIDWDATFKYGFDGFIELIDAGQNTTTLPASLYGSINNANWYLREIAGHPDSEW